MRTRRLWIGLAACALVVVLCAAGLGGWWWWSSRITPVRAARAEQFVGIELAGEAVGRLTGVSMDGDALGQGTAFFVGPEVVVTAWHVIHLMSGGSATVEMADGRVFEVTRVLGVDERVDLAVLRVSPANEGAVLEVAPAAGAEDPEEPLTVVTSPLLFERTRAEGMGRVLHGTPFYGRLLILEAATAPGWSGSPVLDSRGRVRGVVAMGGLTVTMGAPGELIEELRGEPGTPLKKASGVPRTVEGLVVLKHRLAEMMREDEPGEAIHTLRLMLTYMPDHWPTRELLGDLLIERGSIEEGLDQLEQAAWLSPYPRWQFQRLAEEYERAGRAGEAAAARAKAEELGATASDAMALVNRGAAHAEAGAWDEAVAAFSEVVGLMPEHALARLMLGKALVHNERFGEAEPHLRLAVERRGDTESRWYLVMALVESGKIAEAEGLLRGLIDEEPENDQYRMNLGRVLRELGRLEESEEQLRRAIEIAPEWRGNHMFLAETLLAAGRSDEAVEAYRRAVELEPGWERGAVKLAQMLAGLDRHEEAEGTIRAFLEHDEGSGLARGTLGRLLRQMGRYEEGAEQSRLAAAAMPDRAIWHHDLGLALTHLERYEESAVSFRRAIELEPRSGLIAARLADVLARLDRRAEAIALLREHLGREANKEAEVVHGTLGELLQDSGQSGEAVEHLRRGVSHAPEYVPWRIDLADALHATGATDKALRVIEDGIALEERNPWLREWAAWLAATLNRREAAAAHLAVLRELDSDRAAELEEEFAWLKEGAAAAPAGGE